MQCSLIMSSQDRKIFDLGTNIFIENLDPDVDEKIVYDTFSTIGVIAYNPKSPLRLGLNSVEIYMESPRCHFVLLFKVVIFANQAGLNMLETMLVSLQDIALEKIFDESGRRALCSDFAKLMQQESVCLQWGDMSLMNKLFLGKCLLHPKRQQ
ncbi:hypothetical protein HID58_074555 [Brassica napus]|uniref:MEKHLA domain-containing protein n=1 Tax=Brassica napus TaxID=3708 RepID=A0ABQ7YHB9_BRANA|nr:hypothetical protein HID58_074555 [Brassica napus]